MGPNVIVDDFPEETKAHKVGGVPVPPPCYPIPIVPPSSSCFALWVATLPALSSDHKTNESSAPSTLPFLPPSLALPRVALS